ncbi:MAG: hypothetical protein R3C26_15715 [Calditrichia bacterium]
MKTWFQSGEFLDMDKDEREGKVPFIWAVDRKKHQPGDGRQRDCGIRRRSP